MELDKALGFAVILAWDDLKKFSDLCSARVVFQSAVGTAVDYLSVWWVDAEGHQRMVCEYWTWASVSHPSGISFKRNFNFPRMVLALDFILMNQNEFTRSADACPEGLTVVYPPTADEFTEATAWMAGIHGVSTNVSTVEAEKVAAL